MVIFIRYKTIKKDANLRTSEINELLYFSKIKSYVFILLF